MKMESKKWILFFENVFFYVEARKAKQILYQQLNKTNMNTKTETTEKLEKTNAHKSNKQQKQ